MKATLLAVSVVLASLTGPGSLVAQFGLAARVGTIGYGAEGAVALNETLVLRGGVGYSPLDVQTTIDSIPVELTMPRAWYNIGVDYYITDAFRLGAGVVFRPDDVQIAGRFDRPVDLGGETLSPAQIGTFGGVIQGDHRAAYLLVGFGRHVTEGVGLSLDVGAAYFAPPVVRLQASGGSWPSADLGTLLALEEASFESDMKAYMRVWPILTLGVGVGWPDLLW